MSPIKIQPGGAIYRLKVQLAGIEPPIWRRLLIPSNTKLEQLHECIQQAFGWQDNHLHVFKIAGQQYGDPDNPPGGDFISERGTKTKLKFLDLKTGDKFVYQYDFGDDWIHEVLIESIEAPDPNGYYPDCIGGARACPPEDCGGIPGYLHLVEAMSDSKHPAHAELLDWLGRAYDPESFDLKQSRPKGLLMMTIS